MLKVYIPALKVCQAWGDLNPPNPNSADIIATYVSKIMLFIDYLASKRYHLYEPLSAFENLLFKNKVKLIYVPYFIHFI